MRISSLLLISTLAACGPGSPAPADESTGAATTAEPSTAVDPTTTTVPTTSGSTTNDTTTSTSTTEVSSSGDSHEFIKQPDGGPCFADAADPDKRLRCSPVCDIFAQDCPAGKKCVPWADDGEGWNSIRCIEVTGDGVAGDPCTMQDSATSGIDDCAAGHICWDVDAELHGTCVPMCTGNIDAPVCPENTGCLIANDNVLALCLLTCDPLMQDCPVSDACVQFSKSPFLCIPDRSGDNGQANDECTGPGLCDPGLACITPMIASSACEGEIGCCTPFCALPDGPCPNPDQMCIPWYTDMPPPGDEDVGVCLANP